MRGQAIYRATYHTRSWSELCSGIEDSVRASYPREDGFAIHLTRRPACILRVYRGMTSGFSIQLIPQRASPGEGNVLVAISRWSRWHTLSVHVATACFFLALCSCIVFFAVAGWQLPGIGYIIAGISFSLALAVLWCLRPVLAAVSYSGGNRLTDDEMAAVVKLVRVAAEQSPGIAVGS